MLKYLVITVFILTFYFLIKRDRVYLVPMILIIFSNVNGLLGWEDFALKGLIKFQDYGLLLTLLILFFDRFTLNRKTPQYGKEAIRSPLYLIVQFYWMYYLALFLFSIAIQGGIEWPVKMGRMFFYGWIFFLIYLKLLPDPVANFNKIINCLMIATIVFGLFYVAYNVLGWEVYPKGEHEVFSLAGLDDVKRNFSGFPTFAYYFIFLFTHRLMTDTGSKIINLFGLLLLMLCVLLMLTRGTMILTAVMMLFTIFYRKLSAVALSRILMLVIALFIAVPLIMFFAEGHYQAMLLRFSEFSSTGLSHSGNFLVRASEFSRIIKNVMDFDPFFGFGFTYVAAFGYTSSLIHGGSADNGFANLIGTTGFVGLFIFIALMFLWAKVNLKLQALQAEPYSKVNFVFMIFMMGSFLNGSSMSYMHAYALFLAYDLLAYAYLKKMKSEPFQNMSHDKLKAAFK